MLDREACERRVYRLATLLTGNPVAATKVIAQVVDAQPDLRNLDSAHMDRLTVLRSREITSATLVHENVPQAIASTLASLSQQQREAWIFARVYRMEVREMSKAMDCSTAATQRHLEQADATLQQKLGVAASKAPQIVLSYSMTLEVPPFYRVQRRRKRRLKAVGIVLGVALLVALAAALYFWRRGAAAGG